MKPGQVQSMSGGGIRSAAFQLGVLSGLHSVHGDSSSLLAGVDYLSSVSGGSWANGAYWSSPLDDPQLFECLDAYAVSSVAPRGCEFAPRYLRERQEIHILPLNDDLELTQRKLAWERDIADAYLGVCNIDFERAHDYPNCLAGSKRRPYPIFNSTHSAGAEASGVTHFPFETTPHYVGTVVDDPDKGVGFFLRLRSNDFRWQLRKWQRYFALTSAGREDQPGAVLSLTLAHSSGVVGTGKPFLLQYHFHARFRGRAIGGIRRTYQLTDGGKSENLGVLPLLERGVDVIIVSQMGKEGEDFDDIALAARQARRLFGCDFRSDWPRNIDVVLVQEYVCPTGGGKSRVGRLIQVRPTTTNVTPFLEYLRQQNPDLHQAIVLSDNSERAADRFPETPTFRARYPAPLVRAYYLLGRYVVQTKLREALAGVALSSRSSAPAWAKSPSAKTTRP